MRNLFKSALSHINPVGLERLRQAAVLLLDEDLCVVHANAHAESLLRSPAFLLQGTPAAILFHDSEAVEWLLQRELGAHLPHTSLPPTYLLRDAASDRAQRLWRARVHVLREEQVGTYLLLQLTEPRVRPRYSCRQP